PAATSAAAATHETDADEADQVRLSPACRQDHDGVDIEVDWPRVDSRGGSQRIVARAAGSSAIVAIVRLASGGSSRGDWIQAHGPRRRKTASIPAAAAGRTSLSTRSPTYAICEGCRSSSLATRAKNRGSGL